MKIDKSKMFSIALAKLNADGAVPFPLYLFLRRNEKFIPIRHPGDPLGQQQCEHFQQRQLEELWIPSQFEEIYKNYLEYIEHARTTEPETAPAVAAPAGESQLPQQAQKSEEASLVRDVLEDTELTAEEKAEVLANVSQDMMRSLNQITTRGEAARAEGFRRCKEIADEILFVAAQDSNIYDGILALRGTQQDIEHSVIVGTMAAMFGMALGFSDEKLLADLTVGAIFHDIGLVRVKPDLLTKEEMRWTLSERKEYERHVDASREILQESGASFHPRVFRMIAEHHENYDGSGFPNGLKGDQIDETSATLHLANLFDRLCTGKQTGEDLSPAEAFDYIQAVTSDPGAVQEVQPELVQRIFQFMLEEKSAAVEMKSMSEARVQTAARANFAK